MPTPLRNDFQLPAKHKGFLKFKGGYSCAIDKSNGKSEASSTNSVKGTNGRKLRET